MTIPPEILTPREQLVDPNGKITRAWWRALNLLFKNSGTLAAPLTIDGNAILNAATISSGGTISSPELPAHSLIGNPTAAPAQPAIVTIGASLATNDGTIDVQPLPARTLSGNPGDAPAAPSAVLVGANLYISGGALNAVAGSSDDSTLAYSIRDTRGQAATLERKLSDTMTLAMLQASPRAGSAGAASGTVTSVASGTGLTGGPITSSGTLSLAPIASLDLLSNITGGSAAPIPNTVTATIDAALGSVQGDILYRSASAWTVLAPGTSGQVLTTGGAAANPAWAPAAGGSSGTPVYATAVACPLLATFTLINNATGGFTITQGATGFVINITSGTANASDSKLHGVSIAAPLVTPYRIAILVVNTTFDGSGPYADFGWSDGTKYQVMGVPGQFSGAPFIFNYTNANTLSGTQSGPFVRTSNWGGVYWVGLRNDGTNLIYEWSNDGVNFIATHSNPISGNFIAAATNIFVGIGAAASSPAAMAIFVYDIHGLTRAFT